MRAVLPAVGEVEAVEGAFGALAGEGGADLVAHPAAAERDDVRREIAAAAEADL